MVKNKKKTLDRIFVFLVVTVVLLLLFLLYLIYPMAVENNYIDVRFEVGDKIGINASSQDLDFGRIVSETVAQKEILIENNFKFPVVVEIYVENNIREYIFAPSKGIFIDAGNREKISFYLKVPKNIESGNYSGQVKLRILKT